LEDTSTWNSKKYFVCEAREGIQSSQARILALEDALILTPAGKSYLVKPANFPLLYNWKATISQGIHNLPTH